MKMAIHLRPRVFSREGVSFRQNNQIGYRSVNFYDNDIFSRLEEGDALIWHQHHFCYKDALFAKQLMYALERCKKKAFPDFNICWHFDDKLGQKFLFEAIGAPHVPSYAFYTKEDALQWIDKTTFPKVFKLRSGAGPANVRLVKTANAARRLVNKAFGKGFSQFDRVGHFKDRLNKFLEGKDSLIGVIKGFGRLFLTTEFAKIHGRELGYAYFQDFIANNSFDIQIKVIGNRAYGIKRLVRKNDLRASGSGKYIFDPEQFDMECIKLAFDVKNRIKAHSVAFDFVFQNDKPLIIEISYTSVVDHNFPGYWDSELNWHNKLVVEETTKIEEQVKSLTFS